MGGQVNELLAKKDRIIERQSNMVCRQVNEWTSEQVACEDRQNKRQTK